MEQFLQPDFAAPPFGPQANGGFFEKERRVAPAAGRRPHLVFILLDDWGWGNAGWNNPSCAHVTPTLDGMVKDGIELSHHYVFKYCSPTRSAIQSGRAPCHVNVLNAAPDVWEPSNPAAGAAGMARQITAMSIKMAADVRGMATLDHSEPSCTPHPTPLPDPLHPLSSACCWQRRTAAATARA